MKTLLINGSPREKGCTYTGLAEVEKTLNANGIDTEIVHIGTKPIGSCLACGACRKLGKCVIEGDLVNETIEKFKSADAIIVGSPVHYASASGGITAFLDRMFYASFGVDKRFKLGAAIVSCRRGGSTAALDQLNKYFTISEMPIVSSQYWNMIHGATPEDVVQDLEGMQVMRVLGENMSWMLKAVELGKGSLTIPEKEKRAFTNFIRR